MKLKIQYQLYEKSYLKPFPIWEKIKKYNSLEELNNKIKHYSSVDNSKVRFKLIEEIRDNEALIYKFLLIPCANSPAGRSPSKFPNYSHSIKIVPIIKLDNLEGE